MIDHANATRGLGLPGKCDPLDDLVGFSVIAINGQCRITYRPSRFAVPWITVIPLRDVPALIDALQKLPEQVAES